MSAAKSYSTITAWGDKDMTNDTDVLWQEVNNLKKENSELTARVAVGEALHKELVAEFRRNESERKEQFDKLISTINTSMESLKNEMAEKRGAAKFGMWVVGLLISLGVPGALFAWYTHGGPPPTLPGK